jgi:hypothetical protein
MNGTALELRVRLCAESPVALRPRVISHLPEVITSDESRLPRASIDSARTARFSESLAAATEAAEPEPQTTKPQYCMRLFLLLSDPIHSICRIAFTITRTSRLIHLYRDLGGSFFLEMDIWLY